MSRSLVVAAFILTIVVGSASASYPPIKYAKDRAAIARSCALLGSKGEGWGLDRQTGAYGCRNIENGNAVSCTADGKCRDYSGDPRWKHIQDLLKGANAPRSVRL